MIMVIMVRSMIMHSMAIAKVTARARRGPVSGSQRMSWPVVARVPPAAMIRRTMSGMTGIAATSAIRPVRQGLGSSRSSHQIPTSVCRLLAGNADSMLAIMHERRHLWQRQRSLVAPLTLGQPPRLIGDVIDRAVQEARGELEVEEDVIVGQPASAGRATGPVRIVQGVEDFGAFRTGDVLVAKATAPAWTPLFARAAALITDGGTLAAHASLVAREFAIPAVVGTGDAIVRLHSGQLVTVDGAAGTVTPHEKILGR
jgi:phosphohistidine swiveling domain-containing protein